MSTSLERIDEKFQTVKENLHLEDGHVIWGKDCADTWKNLNSFFLGANSLKFYRQGNRHIVPRITLIIERWENLIPLEIFGYGKTRIPRLVRNYLNEESLAKCKAYLEKRPPEKVSSHGLHFGTGKKRTPICLVGGSFTYLPGRLLPTFLLRASEVTKTFGADLHFLDKIIREATPDWMSSRLGSVVIRLEMAYQLAQWFPLIDVIMPGYPLQPYDHRYHRMCIRSLDLARDFDHESKWKPERRLHRHYRRVIQSFKTDQQGRVLSGPSFFPFPKKHVQESSGRGSSR